MNPKSSPKGSAWKPKVQSGRKLHKSKRQLSAKSAPTALLTRESSQTAALSPTAFRPTPSTRQFQSKPPNQQPLSYRHLYHAGNHADVMKHAILVTLAAQQIRKIPFGRLFIDTHAGPGGTYDLQHEYARKTQECDHGIGRIYDIARISALNPHITSETTLRRGVNGFDHGYTQDPMYLRLHTPASDLFGSFPFVNGIASPGAKTISPTINQQRADLIVPVMNTPHPLTHAAGDSPISIALESRVKEGYLAKLNARRATISARKKLQRQLTKLRSHIQTLYTQQKLIHQLKTEFAMLNAVQVQNEARAAQVEVEFDGEFIDSDINEDSHEQGEFEQIPDPSHFSRSIKPPRDLHYQRKRTGTSGGDDSTSDDFSADLDTEDIDSLESSEGSDPDAVETQSTTTTAHTINSPISSTHSSRDHGPGSTNPRPSRFIKPNSISHNNSRERDQGPRKTSFTPNHANFPFRQKTGQNGDDLEEDIPPTPSEAEDDLMDRTADRVEAGPVPEVAAELIPEFTNSRGERVTFRRLGKAPLCEKTDSLPEGQNQSPFPPPPNPSPLFTKAPKVDAEGLTRTYTLDDTRIITPAKSFQENQEQARRRAINILTRRLASQYDPIEEVADLVHNLHVELKIPTKNNSLLTSHSNTVKNPDFPLTRTNQLHTTQLLTYFRHLLPIPSSMLPYISLIVHASKPPTLTTLSPSANYADLLVGDGISKEKAKALEERQSRDLQRSGSFSSSIRLTKQEKLQLHKEIINGSVMDAYLNNVDDEYHSASNEVQSNHLLRGLDGLERQGLPPSQFDKQATALIGKNMSEHKPHITLSHPLTKRPLFPSTSHVDEWIDSSNASNFSTIQSLSESHGVINEDSVYTQLQRVPAQAILFAPDPVQSKKERLKQKYKPKGTMLKEHQFSAQRKGFEIDMIHGLDQIPVENQRGSRDKRAKKGHVRSNRSDFRQDEQSTAADFGINLSALGGNVSIKVNSFSDDRAEKRNQLAIAAEQAFDGGATDNVDGTYDKGPRFGNRSDRNHGDSHGSNFGRNQRDSGNDRRTNFNFNSENNERRDRRGDGDFQGGRRDFDRRNNSNRNEFNKPQNRPPSTKSQQHQHSKPPKQPNSSEPAHPTPVPPPTPIKMSLRDLKHSSLTSQKRQYSTLTGPIRRRLVSRSSPLLSQLPPTLQNILPIARLGLINPQMVTNILSRHFSTETNAGSIWKKLLEDDKSKQDPRKSHTHSNQNSSRTKSADRTAQGKWASSAPKPGGKTDKGKSAFLDRQRSRNGDQTGHLDEFIATTSSSDRRRRVEPLGSSRKSRDKAKAKAQRLEIWAREAPSTKIAGIEDDSERSTKPQRDTVADINTAFVEYDNTVPLVTTAPVKALYSSAGSPIDTLTALYFKYNSKTRTRNAKKNKKVLPEGITKQPASTQAQGEEGDQLTQTQDGGIQVIDDFNYRQDLEDAYGTLFDNDASTQQRFTALTDYENYFKMAEHALSYLYRSGSVYTHSDKLYHIPLMQPLFNAPSSPWIMNNLLRDQIYSPASKALLQASPQDSTSALPEYFPMIKDILVMNELHSTEYQTLRSHNGDTIFNEFFKESLLEKEAAMLDELDIKTSVAMRGGELHETSPSKLAKLDTFHKNLETQQGQIGDVVNGDESSHQRANRVPEMGKTLGDAIGRLAATLAVELSQDFNQTTALVAQKYVNFNKLNLPVSVETHGAHNIYIEEPSKQTFAFQYNGFQSAQIFLKQFQYYMDFLARMSYSATNPSSPAVQYINNIHDEQFQQYQQLHNDKYGSSPTQQRKQKHDNFISTSLILCDPAYETGEEYVHVLDLLRTTLDFNSRGNAHTLAIWYPILDKIDPNLPDNHNFQEPHRAEAEQDDRSFEENVSKFDMNSVTRRDINRGHFLTSLSAQFSKTPKHQHHKLFLSISSFLVNKYRSTMPSPLLSNSPYKPQAPTGNLDTCIAETYVGIPNDLPKQRKNIYMSGSGMLVQSPLLPQELDQSLSTMLPWISTALHVNSTTTVYSHVLKSKQTALNGRSSSDSVDLTSTELPPIADFTLHWM